MLYLFLGADDFTKKEEINSLVKAKGADLVMYGYDEEAPTIEKLLEADLFSKPKVFVLNLPPALGEEVLIFDKLISSQNHIVISVSSLDNRKKENKDLLANPKIIIKEFILPHGMELNNWILERVSVLGGKIAREAVNELAVRLGRDGAKETKFGGKVVSVEEVYNLWQANSEIGKLVAFAKGREILKEDVIDLVSENGEVDALQITNAIAEKQRDESFALIGQFLKQVSASDEKVAESNLKQIRK
jgi:DNA polymerase III delta subunit